MRGKRHYRELFEDAVDVLYSHDLDGNFTAVNKAVERTCGYSRSAVLRMSVYQLLDEESGERVREKVRELLGGRAKCAFRVTAVKPDGSRVTLAVGCRLVFRGGRPVGVHGAARDITERSRAEALERDRNRVLELVAGYEPLESVLECLCLLVERQAPGVRCGILVCEEDRAALKAAPSLPPGFVEALSAGRQSAEAEAWSALAARGVPAHLDLLSDAAPAGHGPLLDASLEGCTVVPILSREAAAMGAFLVFRERGSEGLPAESPVLEAASRLAVVAVENRRLNDRLVYQALHDTLTGLPNRLFFEERLERSLEEARRRDWMLAVFYIDLDRFKQINDTLGHPTGDRVLRQAAERLAGAVRKGDCLARLGGDEFGLVLSGLTDARDARRVAEKLLSALAPPFRVAEHELFLTASIGISVHPRDGKDAAILQSNADAAMYRAKSRGAGCAEFFTPELSAAAAERMGIEVALRRALEHGELELHYQPQTEAGHRLAAVEALLVWSRAGLGLALPRQVISVAEECGMIVPIGVWTLREACRQNAAWRRAGLPPVKVAVKVSPVQFARADFVETVAQALADSGLDPPMLELELNESVLLKEPEETVRQARRLKSLGVDLAIDGFGAGYSSLSCLRLLPVDSLKIDPSFLREVERDLGTVPLLRAIVALAHGLGLAVVAEGVETQQQFETLRRIGCDRFQGCLLGEPAPAPAMERLLAAAGDML